VIETLRAYGMTLMKEAGVDTKGHVVRANRT
jgi:hypothetical protein